MKNLFIWYPKCSTCKNAKKWLEENNITFKERDIVNNNPNFEELKQWIDASGLEIKRFFNTSGLQYRKLNLKDNLINFTDDEKIKLLSQDGMLIKRPLFIKYNEKTIEKVLVGFRKNEWDSIIIK